MLANTASCTFWGCKLLGNRLLSKTSTLMDKVIEKIVEVSIIGGF